MRDGQMVMVLWGVWHDVLCFDEESVTQGMDGQMVMVLWFFLHNILFFDEKSVTQGMVVESDRCVVMTRLVRQGECWRLS